MEKKYKRGEIYRNSTDPSKDQILYWLNTEGSGIDNSRGIRELHFSPKRLDGIPAVIILTSTEHKTNYDSPWGDEIYENIIRYWGDAKSYGKPYDKTRGNKCLLEIKKRIFQSGTSLNLSPPALHFTKIKSGYMRFNGTFYISQIDKENSEGYTNLFLHLLRVPKYDEIYVDWIKRRVRSYNVSDMAWIPNDIIIDAISETSKKSLIDSRIGQSKFRDNLMHRWAARCSVTGCELAEILISSHIKPWRDSNHCERLDINNGLLLIPTLDSLFDLGFITFSESGSIMLSDSLNVKEREKLGINKKMKLAITPNANMRRYLQYHRNNVFEKRKIK